MKLQTVRQILKEKGIEFAESPTRPEESEEDSLIQIKINKRLFKSILDH